MLDFQLGTKGIKGIITIGTNGTIETKKMVPSVPFTSICCDVLLLYFYLIDNPLYRAFHYHQNP